jgi:hypothetical protein
MVYIPCLVIMHYPELLATQNISLNLYFDDVHGMSWRGKMELVLFLMQYKELRKLHCGEYIKQNLQTSGATVFCRNQKLRDKIKILLVFFPLS